ncbi:DUF4132 domain-containing protein [Massilia genomosp. 1]|uniref:DUF4132 domain-containing protein n=1 Tax=Massilia genomosp. 1 TaxID=2609280 RepID=A0ABX0MLS6_9BURK|nr:DUF4132 domain-containing protein [Massilia genomosp. 1]NHZ63706.1 DUF4132 domain-containing protein [Massilia genomosp. 1]
MALPDNDDNEKMHENMRRFELNDSVSSKFWEVTQDGSDVTVCFGKIGSAGKAQTKNHPDAAAAHAAVDKLIREKTGKGYVETGAGSDAQAVPPKPAPVVAPSIEVPLAPAAGIAPWLAVSPLIDVPPALMALALPTRQFPGTPPVVDADKSWTRFLKRAREVQGVEAKYSGASWKTAIDEATRRIKQGLRSGSAASDMVLLAVSTVFDKTDAVATDTSFLDFLVAEKGLPYALGILLDLQKANVDRRYAYEHRVCIDDIDTDWFDGSHGEYTNVELALRTHLVHAPQDVWLACVGMVRENLDAIPRNRQPLFGVLLPDAPELSDALVQGGGYLHDMTGWLRMSVRDPESLALLDSVRDAYYLFYDKPAFVATAIRDRGADAVAVLKHGVTEKVTADALACIGTPDAIGALALACGMRNGSPSRLEAAARRWPWAAIAGLSELLGHDRQAPDVARATLSRLVPDHIAALASLRPWLSPAALKVLDDMAARFCEPGEMAASADLPAVLQNPPWTAPRQARPKALDLAPLPLAAVERWSAAERQFVLNEKRHKYNPYQQSTFVTPADLIAAGDVDAVVALWKTRQNPRMNLHAEVRLIADLPPPFNKAVWTALAKHEFNSPGYAIATLGIDCLPGLVTMCELRPEENLCYALHFGAVELAFPVAHAMATLKNKPARAIARRWLLANPEHSACGLLAPALGKAGKTRDAAAAALRLLAAHGHGDVLIDVARRYGIAAVDSAVQAMLDEDPLDLHPARIPVLPSLWAPRSWHRPRLRSNGKPLSDEALGLIGIMLQFPRSEGVYAGLEQVRQACMPASLDAFAWDLFRAWHDLGGDPSEKWAFTALGVFGNDNSARKLTPLIRAWPGDSLHARAVTGLDVLAGIGTDLALMLLNGVALKLKFKALQDSAREKIKQIADARDLTPEELEDRLAPTLGLDDQGSLLLDFGPRQFRVGFDEALKPYVRDAGGARLADLPKPNKSDDAGLAASAVDTYKLLKKDARTIATQQVRRLEAAMCARRLWDGDTFLALLARHPLVRHLVQRLVWGVYQAGSSGGACLAGCFRVGPDGALTDAADDDYVLQAGARVGIVHALELPASDADAFGKLFADYELLQPFPQIGRETYALTQDELAADELLRWVHLEMPADRLMGLTNKGWHRGKARDAGGIWAYNKDIGAGRTVELGIYPGLDVNKLNDYPEQTLQAVKVGSMNPWGDIGTPQPLSVLDPIAASELIRDLEFLRT